MWGSGQQLRQQREHPWDEGRGQGPGQRLDLCDPEETEGRGKELWSGLGDDA